METLLACDIMETCCECGVVVVRICGIGETNLIAQTEISVFRHLKESITSLPWQFLFLKRS